MKSGIIVLLPDFKYYLTGWFSNDIFHGAIMMKGNGDFPNINTKRPDGIKPGGKPFKVMVVEEKEFQKKQIVQILESENYKIVATASNGREALQKFDMLNGDVDLVTTTLDMPILDGYALVYELNQRPKNPVIVFISEETTKGVMQDLLSMKIADYILKPIDRRTVLARIKNAIEKKQKSQTSI
jgi:two-component system chemotaxis response regulator CheY